MRALDGKVAKRRALERSEQGVALILVMLCVLVLSVLSASIVFSARSETFASYNYRITTQADYTAKAGLHMALNFFTSDNYKPVSPTSAPTTYQVSEYSSSPVSLYNTLKRPVQCQSDIGGCDGTPVVLSVDGDGDYNGDYPTGFTNDSGKTIPKAFQAMFSGTNVTLNPLSSATNSGQFTVRATLIDYFTVNDAFYPTVNKKPYEVWHVVSTGTWNSNVGAAGALPTSVQEATLGPVYLPYFANALYGLCSISLAGNVCTDSYNSRAGNYNGCDAKNCVGSTACPNAASNALTSGASVGSGGGVSLSGSNYIVNGDVSYGSDPPDYSSPWNCPSGSSGVTGSVGGVRGTVQPVPAIPVPPMPTFPNCSWYGGSGSCSSYPVGQSPPNPTTMNNPAEYLWIRTVSGSLVYQVKTSGGGGTTTNYLLTGNGQIGNPYRLPEVRMQNGGVCLLGGDSAETAVHYDLKKLSTTGGLIYIVKGSNPPSQCPPPAGYNQFGYAVLNIYETMDLAGQAFGQPTNAPPASLAINVYNSGNNSGTSVNMNGNANLRAIITALGEASLGGGGTNGAFYGAILAGSVKDNGTYSVHYDQSLQVVSGKLKPMTIRTYNRPKF